ncbi:protein disulfide-isomerase A4 isoform X3 [Oryctolagus cuniculus]|uniref:protein disulfide-isomerase A4 isoform X3 n=1 Tax=Oryctolagus cuniculus TaxID=9986 RepID=UPI00387A5E47
MLELGVLNALTRGARSTGGVGGEERPGCVGGATARAPCVARGLASPLLPPPPANRLGGLPGGFSRPSVSLGGPGAVGLTRSAEPSAALGAGWRRSALAAMRPRKACLLVLLFALAQLLAVASAGEADEDSSVTENAIEDEEEEEEDEDDEEEDDLEVKEENGVLVLNDANFDNFVADKDTVLLEFYAPWCGHCKQFAPEYEKIAKVLKENDPPIAVAKIDATSASMLASRFDVSGYPTIKILKKGQAVDYEGSRTQEEIVAKVKEVSQPNWTPPPEVTLVLTKDNFDDVVNDADIILVEFYAPCFLLAGVGTARSSPPSTRRQPRSSASARPQFPWQKSTPRQKQTWPRGIVDYMIEQSGPPSKEVPTLKQVQEFLKDGDDVIIIGVFKGESDPAYQQYQDAANNLREDYKFHHTFSTEIAKFLKVSPGKLVVMQPEKFQSKYEPRTNVLDIQGSTEGSAIKDHVVKHALPLVGHRKTSNDAKRYTKRPLVVVYYGVDFSFDYRAATQFWRSKVLEVAKDFPEYTFAIADEEDYAAEVKDLGLSESGEDVNAAILDESGRKFAMEPEEFDSDVLREFVTAFKKGKLKPVIKSQPVPKNNKGPVQVVVGKTFDSIVMDPKKDVLIEFYAPWCGHCKQLEPIYTSLAKKYKSHKGLVIAKMDATANDITSDRYKVDGFPTIYFAPRGDKKNPIKFEGGDRDLEHLSQFVDEHTTAQSRTKEEL